MSDAAEFGYTGLAPALQQATGNATKHIFMEPHLNNESYIGFSFFQQKCQMWKTKVQIYIVWIEIFSFQF